MTAYLIAFLVWFFQRNSNFYLSNASPVLPCLNWDKCTRTPAVQCVSYS